MKRSPVKTDIAGKILILRGEKVMLAPDLAELYGVTTTRLNEQVRRNLKKFPSDFMFQLTGQEKKELIAKCENLAKLKFSPAPPLAFTEHGALMAANVLNSERATEMSVFIIRAFVKMREMIAQDKGFAEKLDKLEKRMDKTGADVEVIFTAVRQLMAPPETSPKKKIGFANKLK